MEDLAAAPICSMQMQSMMMTRDLKHVKAEGDSHALDSEQKLALNRKLKTTINQFWAPADVLPIDVNEKYESQSITRVHSWKRVVQNKVIVEKRALWSMHGVKTQFFKTVWHLTKGAYLNGSETSSLGSPNEASQHAHNSQSKG